MRIDVDKMKGLMRRCKMTQKSLAEEIGFSISSVNQVRYRGSCKPETLVKISSALDVDPMELLAEFGLNQPKQIEQREDNPTKDVMDMTLREFENRLSGIITEQSKTWGANSVPLKLSIIALVNFQSAVECFNAFENGTVYKKQQGAE